MRQLFILIAILAPFFAVSQEPFLKYYNNISPDSIRESVFILSSDSMEGRETGRQGQKKASFFLSSKYKSWGLAPVGNLHESIKINALEDRFGANPFLQNHPISIRNNKSRNLIVKTETFLFGKDFIYSDFSVDASFKLNKFIFISPGIKTNARNILFSKTCKNKIPVFLNVKEGDLEAPYQIDKLLKSKTNPLPSIVLI